MKIAIITHEMVLAYGETEGIRRLADIGYDGLDFGLNIYPLDGELFSGSEAAIEDYFAGLKEVADRAGIVVNQVHAQIPSYWHGNPEKTAFTWQQMPKAILAAASLGSPYIVIHPVVPPTCKDGQGHAGARALNMEFFGALTPYLEKHKVQLGIENMYTVRKDGRHTCPTVCSTAEEMIDYIDSLGPSYVGCLDTGHSMLSGSGAVDMTLKLGSRLKLIHAQDNDGSQDDHMGPMPGFQGKFLSSVDWPGFADALKTINYEGMFSLEPDNFLYGHRPLVHEAAAFLYKITSNMLEEYGLR